MKSSKSYSIQKILNNILFKKILLLTGWIIFCATIFYTFYSHKDNWNTLNNDKEHLSFTDILYFTTVTMFTVGYGDITPKTKIIKYLLIIKLYINFIIVSL
jgi:hypothetical protein